jgi:hypothetical protein
MLRIKRGLSWKSLTMSSILLIAAVSMIIMAGVQINHADAYAHQDEMDREYHMQEGYDMMDHHMGLMKHGKHHNDGKHGGFHVAMFIFAIILTLLSIAGIVLSIIILRRTKHLASHVQTPQVSSPKVNEPSAEQSADQEQNEAIDSQDSDEKKD